jgi:hypothetical protein
MAATLCLYRSSYDFKRLFTLSEFYGRDRGAFYAAIQGVRERELTAPIGLWNRRPRPAEGSCDKR